MHQANLLASWVKDPIFARKGKIAAGARAIGVNRAVDRLTHIALKRHAAWAGLVRTPHTAAEIIQRFCVLDGYKILALCFSPVERDAIERAAIAAGQTGVEGRFVH